MKTNTAPTTPAPVTLHRPPAADWRAFAAAAGAGLAAVTHADAAIIYGNPGVDVKLPGPSPYNAPASVHAAFTIGGFAKSAFLLGRGQEGAHSGKPIVGNYASLRGNANVFIPTSTVPFALKFGAGQAIGGSSAANRAALFFHGNTASGKDLVNVGSFPAGQTGLAGIRLPNGDLGWIKVEVIDRNGDGYPDELKILGDAYNTVSGAPILAGQGEPAAVPEPGTNALLLAAGSAGVLAWRKRRARTVSVDASAAT